jgi:hypothetical protein
MYTFTGGGLGVWRRWGRISDDFCFKVPCRFEMFGDPYVFAITAF